MKILLAVDGSEYTKRMLAYIAAHDELLGKSHEYLVFTAATPIPRHLQRYLDRNMIETHQREEAEQILEPVKAFAEMQGWTISLHHEAGSAAKGIARLAKQEAVDLIVMGTHGHSAMSHLVMGSVTNEVLATCEVPVLLVR